MFSRIYYVLLLDYEVLENLSQQAQLNCAVDFGAKQVLLSLNPHNLPRQKVFPLKAISVWVEGGEMTSNTGSSVTHTIILQGKNLTQLWYCHFNSLIK